ncbi:precorrin-3B synthase [Rhodoligotrophos defluvii]|uniref:precorrin-3B synthase n=1 Tax=Rhodoligotrophos defluvii TaxID=2561934 RepID=UPI0010CA066E|nr:precorrin-3B synthase [Rhodoligotrophos defluvii]
MSLAAEVKGWCPTVLRPMASGDGLLVRVKPSAATLSLDQARRLAEAAQLYGNGIIELTNRANLQMRGLDEATVARFAAEIQAAGLAADDPALEQTRNVLASPLGSRDPTATFDAHALARAIEGRLAAAPLAAALDLKRLPAKFGFVVDGGGALPLAGIEADILLRGHGGGIAVRLAGCDLAARTNPADAPDVAIGLAHAFLALASGQSSPPRRMRNLVDQIGAAEVFRRAGLEAEHLTSPAPAAERPFRGPGWISLGLPFGQIDARLLQEMVYRAGAAGAKALHATPWRAFVLSGLSDESAADLLNWAAAAGLITSSEDARLNIAACPGQPYCRSATVPTRRDGERLARSGAAADLDVHLSGCRKGCARRGPADFTLVGGSQARYALVEHGSAGDEPLLTGLTLDEIINHLREKRAHAPRHV